MSKKVINKADNISENNYNCVLNVKKENGYINFSLDIDDIKDVKVRLVVPNNKLASKIYYKVNKK